MQAKALFTIPALCALIGLGAVGCGGGGDDTSPAATSTTESTDTGTEVGEDSNPAAGGNGLAPSGDAVRSAEVEIEDFAYRPDPVTIEEGGKVIWKNRDSAPHTATAADGSFDTGTIEEDKLKAETFKEPGTYAYVCSIHPQMHGTVEVVAAS